MFLIFSPFFVLGRDMKFPEFGSILGDDFLGTSSPCVSSLPLLLELDAFSAGNMFEGILNKDTDMDISIGLYQLYQPSTKCA